jgi:signal peptidase II
MEPSAPPSARRADQRAKYIRLLLVGGLVILADQLTKTAVTYRLALHESVAVIGGFFNLTHIRNPGGAFGLLAAQSSSLRVLVFILVSLAAVGIILWFYHRLPRAQSWLATGFALIFGGAVGNLIDRIRFGRVIDFLDFFIGDWHWPAFNIADSAITVGVFIFGYHLLFGRIPE